MHPVIIEKTEDTMTTKETEERRGKCEETMMFEDKRENALMYVLQTIKVAINKENYR